jgi:hypothetical protein
MRFEIPPRFEFVMNACPRFPVRYVLPAERCFLLLLFVVLVSTSPGCRRSSGPSSAAGTVRLNEVMGRNASIPVADGSGAGFVQDWVEIHNPGTQAVNLTEFSLSDNQNRPDKFVFPRGTLLGGGEFLIVFLVSRNGCQSDCDVALNNCRLQAGSDSEALLACDVASELCQVQCSPGGLVADFGLSATAPDGESVFLFDPNKELVDRLGVRLPQRDVSNGRFPDSTGTPGLIYLPTPGSANKPVGLQAARYSSTAGSGDETQLSDSEPHDLHFIVERDQVFEEELQRTFGEVDVFVEYVDLEAPSSCPPSAAMQASLTYTPAPVDLLDVQEATELRQGALGETVEASVLQLSYAARLPPVACGTVRFYRVIVDDPLLDGLPVADRGCLVSCGAASVLVNEYQPQNTKIVFESVNSRGEPRSPRTPDWIELRNVGTESISNIGDYLLVGLRSCDTQAFNPREHTLNALRGFKDSSGHLLPLEALPPGGFLWILADKDNNARRSYTLVGDPEQKPFFSTQFGLNPSPNSGIPDGFCLLSPAFVTIDRVVLDFRDAGLVFDQDQSVARFPDREGDRPNALQPGTVTDCPTPGGDNAVECELPPSFEEVVLLVTPSGDRCPNAGDEVIIHAQVNIDADTLESEFDVQVRAEVAGSVVEASVLTVSRAEDQRAAKPAMALYDIEARLTAGQDGDLVTLQFEARDDRLGGDSVVYDESTAESLFPGTNVSLRYVVGFVPPADGPLLSELLPFNRSVVLPPFVGLEAPRFPDFAEVHNPAESALDLEGYYLTGVPALGEPIRRARRFRFPTGSVVPAGGYLLVYFGPPPAATPPLTPPEYIEVRGFDLACDSEALLLIAPDAAESGANCVLDALSWNLQSSLGCRPDVAVGRLCPEDDDAVELATVTPGGPNTSPTLVHGAFHELLLEGDLNTCLGDTPTAVRLNTVVFVDQGLLETLGTDSILEASYFVDSGFGEILGRPQVSAPRAICDPGNPTSCVEPPPGYGIVRIAHLVSFVTPGLTYRVEFSDACGERFEVGPFTLGSASEPHPSVVVNELNRSAEVEGESDTLALVELYNASAETVSLGGMFLSDEPFAPRKARLSDGLTVGPLATVVLSLEQLGLVLAPTGRLYLMDSTARGNCVIDEFPFDFSGLPVGTSLGREPDGSENIGALETPSFGQVNSGEPTVEGVFVRGDATEDLRVNVLDMVRILDILFEEGAVRPRCLDAADANDDGLVNITDVGFAGNAVFGRGAPPPPPFPEPGLDPTPDDLPCPP